MNRRRFLLISAIRLPTSPRPSSTRGTVWKIRELKNNLVFVAADERSIPNMRDLVRRRLALGQLLKPEHQRELADYQQGKIKAECEKLKLDVAMAILQCYRDLFYPSSSRMTGAQIDLGHTIIELSGEGDSPGNGQHQVERVLHELKELLELGTVQAVSATAHQLPAYILCVPGCLRTCQ